MFDRFIEGKENKKNKLDKKIFAIPISNRILCTYHWHRLLYLFFILVKTQFSLSMKIDSSIIIIMNRIKFDSNKNDTSDWNSFYWFYDSIILKNLLRFEIVIRIEGFYYLPFLYCHEKKENKINYLINTKRAHNCLNNFQRVSSKLNVRWKFYEKRKIMWLHHITLINQIFVYYIFVVVYFCFVNDKRNLFVMLNNVDYTIGWGSVEGIRLGILLMDYINLLIQVIYLWNKYMQQFIWNRSEIDDDILIM